MPFGLKITQLVDMAAISQFSLFLEMYLEMLRPFKMGWNFVFECV